MVFPCLLMSLVLLGTPGKRLCRLSGCFLMTRLRWVGRKIPQRQKALLAVSNQRWHDDHGTCYRSISSAQLVQSIFYKITALLLITNHITSLATCLLGQLCVAVGSMDLTKLSLKIFRKKKFFCINIFLSFKKM